MSKYKHGKINEAMEFETWKEYMDKAKFIKSFHKSFLALLYWTGLRLTEILDRTTKDFSIENNMLVLDAPAKKGGERLPLRIPLDLPFMNLILETLERLKSKRRDKRVFPMTDRHARRIVKQVFGEKYYPHFFRLNRATKFLNDPTTTIPQMKAWFGWKSTDTINMYIGYSKRGVIQQANRLYQDLKKE